jgi:hypothetical protein
MIMMLPFFWKTHIIHTKCGGPNERSFFAQYLNNVILFSKENLASFKSNKRFEKATLHLIPNRVVQKEKNMSDVVALNTVYPKDTQRFTFLRIARIGKTYKESILQSIHLLQEVLKTNNNVKLIIIGVRENEGLLAEIGELVQNQNLPVEILTTSEFTSEASRFLYLADAVIGTGRGIMEAMSQSIPVFAPLNGRQLPAYVNPETFETLFTRNFSQRNQMDHITDKMIIAHANKLVKKEHFYDEMVCFSKQQAEENFIITETIKNKYWSIYQGVVISKRKPLIFKNSVPILYYLNAFRRAAKRK